MPEFTNVFLSGHSESGEIFKRLIPLLEARGIKGIRMPFPAQPVDAARASLQELANCRAMILVVRSKYGTPWSEFDGKSITELEYREAFRRRMPLFCFIDNASKREPELEAFVKSLTADVQKRIIYSEADLSNPQTVAERIAADTGTFRWVPSAFASFAEWGNLLQAQYSRITSSALTGGFPPPFGRAKERERFRAWLLDPDPKKNTAIVSGLPGFGKTLFARQCISELLDDWTLTYSDVPVVLPGAELSLDSIRNINANPHPGSAPVVLIIDDADERQDYVALIKQLASTEAFVGGRIKLLLICQQRSVELFYSRGYPLIDKANTNEFRLERLELEDLQAYAKKHGFRVPDATLVSIRKITNGVPIYLDLIFNHKFDIRTIGTHEEMEGHFVHQRLSDVGKLPGPMSLLKALSFTGSISLTHPFFIRVLAELGFAGNQSADTQTLIEQGLIYPVGTKHRVSDRLVQDFMLATYWTQPAERVKIWPLLQAGEDLAPGVLENLARAEWARTKAGAIDKPFQDIWAAVRATFKNCVDAGERRAILRLLKDAAYFLPELSLEIAKDVRSAHLIESRSSQEVEAASDLAFAVAHWPAHFEQAIDVLWDLGKNDERALNAFSSHGHRHLQDLAKYRPADPVNRRQELVLAHIERWLAEPAVPGQKMDHSPIHILDKLLDREWDRDYFYRDRMTLERGQIPYSAALAKLRQDAIALLERSLQGEFPSNVLGESLHQLRSQLPIYQPPEWKELGELTLAALSRVTENHLGAGRPMLPFMVYRMLDDLVRIFDGDGKKEVDPESKGLYEHLRQRLEKEFPTQFAILTATAGDVYLGGNVDEEIVKAQTMLSVMTPRNARILIEGLRKDLGHFGASPSIAVLGPGRIPAWANYSVELYKEFVEHNKDQYLVGHSIIFLTELRSLATKDVVKSAEYSALLATFPGTRPDTELGKILAGYLRWFFHRLLGPEGFNFLPVEIELLRGWAADANELDKDWSQIMLKLGRQNPTLCKELLMMARPGNNSKAADEICSALDSSAAVIKLLTEVDWKTLLSNFVELASLDGFWLTKLLHRLTNIHPRLSSEYFLTRIARYEELRLKFDKYEPVPYDFGEEFGNAFTAVDAVVREKLIEEAVELVLKLDRGVGQSYLYSYTCVVAGRFTSVGIPILLAKIDANSSVSDLLGIAGIIQDSYENFPLDHPDVIEKLLESASRFQKDFISIASCLYAGFGTRSTSRSIGEPSAVHIHLRDSALALKQRFVPGTPTYTFYENLEKSAANDIQREQLYDEEALDG